MKLERIVLATQFDPTKLVTSHEIFSKRSAMLEAERDRDRAKTLFRDVTLFKNYFW